MNYNAPGQSSTKMAYSADGTRFENLYLFIRFDSPSLLLLILFKILILIMICELFRLFSCGTNKQGDSFIVEWNETEGTAKRTYNEFGKQAVGVVQFDTTKTALLLLVMRVWLSFGIWTIITC